MTGNLSAARPVERSMSRATPRDRDAADAYHLRKRQLLGTCLLAVTLGVAACSTDGATPSPDAPPVTVATPEGFGGSVEPGTGTEVVLDLPETGDSGQEFQIPLIIRAGNEPYPWDNATLRIETEGPIIATADIDPADLRPGTSAEGMLTVRPQAGTADELTTGRVSLSLQLRHGDETTTWRGVEFGILADDRTTWLGYVSPEILKLDRLRTLLDAGEISPTEYDDARTEILETVTGTVTVKDPTK